VLPVSSRRGPEAWRPLDGNDHRHRPAQELAFEVGLQRCGVELEHELIDAPVMGPGAGIGVALPDPQRAVFDGCLWGLGGAAATAAVERDDDRGPISARTSAE
jgi:hypothetical protein